MWSRELNSALADRFDPPTHAQTQPTMQTNADPPLPNFWFGFETSSFALALKAKQAYLGLGRLSGRLDHRKLRRQLIQHLHFDDNRRHISLVLTTSNPENNLKYLRAGGR